MPYTQMDIAAQDFVYQVGFKQQLFEMPNKKKEYWTPEFDFVVPSHRLYMLVLGNQPVYSIN